MLINKNLPAVSGGQVNNFYDWLFGQEAAFTAAVDMNGFAQKLRHVGVTFFEIVVKIRAV